MSPIYFDWKCWCFRLKSAKSSGESSFVPCFLTWTTVWARLGRTANAVIWLSSLWMDFKVRYTTIFEMHHRNSTKWALACAEHAHGSTPTYHQRFRRKDEPHIHVRLIPQRIIHQQSSIGQPQNGEADDYDHQHLNDLHPGSNGIRRLHRIWSRL